MNLDGWTVLAQILNFLLLVWLLKRFLYQPVRNVIEEREARLQKLRQEAEAQVEAARAEEQKYKELAARLEADRRRLLDEAVREAERERERLIAEAQREVAAAKEEMRSRLRAERSRLEGDIQAGIVSEVCAAAGKILHELTGLTIAEALIDAVEAKLAPLPPPAVLNGVAKSALEVRTSFEPTPDQLSRLRSLVEQWTKESELEIAFVHDPTLRLGVEIAGAGEIVSWSARDLLDSIAATALAGIDNNIADERFDAEDAPKGDAGGASGDGAPGAVGYA